MTEHGEHGERTSACSCSERAACMCELGSDYHPISTITVTINPEVRVSAAISRASLPELSEGDRLMVPITIVNQAFATLELEAVLLEPRSSDVRLEFPVERLTGRAREQRVMTLTVGGSGPVDVTVGFRLVSEKPDLGGRDRIHFLVQRLA